MDIFDTKGIKPMLIAQMEEPFDSSKYLYEIKFDGSRCIAYLDKNYADLRNKRDKKMLPVVPELNTLYEQVKEKCILDGELAILTNGKPDFYEMQRRTLMKGGFKVELAASSHPASFIAYDIIYYKDKLVTDLPLVERKRLLEDVVIENDRLILSRIYEEKGIQLFELVKAQEMEGVVAKKKDSIYTFDKRTKNWIKFKVMDEDDYIICGYIPKENNMTSIILGQYDGLELIYKGHVTLGVSYRNLQRYQIPELSSSPFGYVPEGNQEATWMTPRLVCAVQSMPTDKSGLRQPVLKGIREDKLAEECIVNKDVIS